jgi:hypothetical protein
MEYLRATSDDEMGEIGPSPSASTPARKVRVPGTLDCGANRSILRCHPRLWSRHSLRIPPRPHPTDEDLSVGAPVCTDFRPQRRPRES